MTAFAFPAPMALRPWLSLALSFVVLQSGTVGAVRAARPRRGAEERRPARPPRRRRSASWAARGRAAPAQRLALELRQRGLVVLERDGRREQRNTICWNGGNYYLYGINYPVVDLRDRLRRWRLGAIWRTPHRSSPTWPPSPASGGHVLRWWIWVDGRYDPLFDSSGHVTGFDSLVLQRPGHPAAIRRRQSHLSGPDSVRHVGPRRRPTVNGVAGRRPRRRW